MDWMKRRKPKEERKEEEIRVRLTSVEKEAWTEAAKRDEREGLSAWVRYVANQAAKVGKSRGGE